MNHCFSLDIQVSIWYSTAVVYEWKSKQYFARGVEMTYVFTITIAASGSAPYEAWIEAVMALAIKPGSTPEDYEVENDDDS